LSDRHLTTEPSRVDLAALPQKESTAIIDYQFVAFVLLCGFVSIDCWLKQVDNRPSNSKEVGARQC
jgi:hypothetical protein